MAEKSPGAFRTISEVADALDVPAHVLRFWETRFTQIKPIKRGGGRRYYRPTDVDLIRGIQRLLYTEGMTIKGAQKVLRSEGVRHVMAMGKDAKATPSPPRRSAPPPQETANVPEMAAEAAHESFGAGFAESATSGHIASAQARGTVTEKSSASTDNTLEPKATEIMDTTDMPDPEKAEAIRKILVKLEKLRDRMRAP